MNDIFNDPKKGLSYFWSFVTALMLGYIIYKWGNEKEILTLIIGLIGGTIIGSIMGLWFGGTNTKIHPPAEGKTTADISATITTDTATKPEENNS